jgi:hypothetical protein
MMRIVTTIHRYKRPPKNKRPVTIQMPVLVAPRKRVRPPADGQSQPEPADAGDRHRQAGRPAQGLRLGR